MVKRIFKHIGWALLAVVLCFTSVFGRHLIVSASAEETKNIVEAYEQTNVSDNLEGAVIAGKEFVLEDYPHNENGKPQLISLVEFCYSYYDEKQSDYGLYVYFYNPQDIPIDASADRNKIQLTFGEKDRYSKYTLEFLNYSKEAGYEGRFYKFRINLSAAQREALLNGVKAESRVYKVSSFELCVQNKITDYPCAQTYTYTGYALGYGSDLAETDSLACRVDGFDDYITLDVNHTVYYKEGDFYHGQQSQLNSCFFRVPDKFFEEYGELTQIAYEWYEYVTNFILVTEDKAIYEAVDGLRGKGLGEVDNGYDYLFCALCDFDSSWFKEKGTMLTLYDGWEMKDEYSWWEGLSKVTVKMKEEGEAEEWLKNLSSSIAAAFYTNGADCKDYSVAASDIMEKFKRNSETMGAPYYGGGYSQSLFCDFVDKGHKRGYNYREISPSDTFEVFWRETTKSLWQRIWGGYSVVTNYDSLPAIVKISASDLNGSDEEIASRLFIHKSDVAKIKSEYSLGRNAEEKETVILFRYGTSTALSMPCGQAASNSSNDRDLELVKTAVTQAAGEDFSAYITQQTVYLDFDIISLTFTKDNVSTVIPVVMSPTDVFSQTNPPDEITTRGNMLSWWQILLGAIALVVIIVLVLKFAPWLIYGIGKMIAMPFRAISKACKSNKERRREKWDKKRLEKKLKKARKPMDKEFKDFDKRCKREEKEVQKNWKKVDVEALKKKILSGEKSESELTKTERFALNQNEEWLIEKEIEDAMYGYDDDMDWWTT